MRYRRRVGRALGRSGRVANGRDCLNYGCVPSKALIAAAHAAHTARTSAKFGVINGEPEVDFAAVRAHVRGVIAAIEPNDSVERFTSMGVRVVESEGRFLSPSVLQAGDIRIEAKKFVVATGSSAMVPPIPGLSDTPYLTNETIFDLDKGPKHLIVIGGGPIGAELAQAHRRLGAQVTMLEMFDFLGKDDAELTAVVRRQFEAEDIDIRTGVKIVKTMKTSDGIEVTIEEAGAEQTMRGSHLLIAAGRRPNIENLDLDVAGIEYSPKGIKVDNRLRTSNRRIFAIGDVISGLQFTHIAGYHAGIVIRNALLKLPAKVKYKAAPWVTYTDPELAHVGMTEDAARKAGVAGFNILRWPFHENDRAQTERAVDGMIKVIVDRKGRVLGATLAGSHAGELLAPWIMAVDQGQKIGTMAGLIFPYPTLSEVSKRAAGSYFTPKLFSERIKPIVRFLQKF
jgi:pyruvate/2-oxoglutarate dehydrogenase complex dihydrolipoamide dehydrogenase (E3) component